MQREIQFLAVIAIFILVFTIAQAYESEYGLDRQEECKEFLRRFLDTYGEEEKFNQR